MKLPVQETCDDNAADDTKSLHVATLTESLTSTAFTAFTELTPTGTLRIEGWFAFISFTSAKFCETWVDEHFLSVVNDTSEADCSVTVLNSMQPDTELNCDKSPVNTQDSFRVKSRIILMVSSTLKLANESKSYLF